MADKQDELTRAKMAAAEIAFYLQNDFDDDTCTLASLQSDLSKATVKSSHQPNGRSQRPGAYWTPLNANGQKHQPGRPSQYQVPFEDTTRATTTVTAEAVAPLVTKRRSSSRLSAPQPAEPLGDGASRRREKIVDARRTDSASNRRETISEAKKTCRKVELLLEGAFDALDPNVPKNQTQQHQQQNAREQQQHRQQEKIPEDTTLMVEKITPKESQAAVVVSAPRTPPTRIISTVSTDDDSTVAAAQPTALVRGAEVSRNHVPDTPGAFIVRPGMNASANALVEVEDDEEAEEQPEDEWNELDRILDVDEEEWNRLDAPNDMKTRITESNLVVAAQLTTDAEASIHDQVRQSILERTPRASVVHVEHGGSKSSREFEDPIAEAMRKAELARYKPRGVKEKLFGDGKTAMLDIGAAPDDYIRKRDTLPFTVRQDTTTNNWCAFVQTNQKAWEASISRRPSLTKSPDANNLELMRSLKTFSAKSEKEAYETGLAMAPPAMDSLDENPICFLCKTKFAVFRRPHHCRNCGVVVCSSCACSWSSRRVPSTYNLAKKEKVIVCLGCDWLADNFQKTVRKGNLEKAKSLYKTGNVNLRHPYGAWKKNGDEVL
jgi:hypothetical protein